VDAGCLMVDNYFQAWSSSRGFPIPVSPPWCFAPCLASRLISYVTHGVKKVPDSTVLGDKITDFT